MKKWRRHIFNLEKFTVDWKGDKLIEIIEWGLEWQKESYDRGIYGLLQGP